ncbi:MAG: HDOD domain-containing protein [Pirellulaceae bacterium]
MKRILFVDDEPKVLQGLQRMFRSLRREWQMEFAEGGAKALECLAASPFDVVLTDMRMPGMDGSELLDEVMRCYPATVRIVLSGQCDRQTVLKCVRPAHQFLTKPCASETIRSTVARACNSRDRMVHYRHKCMLSRVISVPSRPSVYAELVAELESPQASIRAVGEIVSRDVGMTAKILQLVSSSFFGSPRRVEHPAEAITLLGLDTVKSLAFSTEAFVPFELDSTDGRWLSRLTDHSLAVGTAARAIAESETKDRVLAGDAMLAGFLHEVGSLALVQPFPSDHEQQYREEVETLDGEESHAEAGAYLMSLWGLPASIVTAIAFQHCPSSSSEQSFTPLTALHAANAILHAKASNAIGASGTIDVDYLKRIGCADRLEKWHDKCQLTTVQEA